MLVQREPGGLLWPALHYGILGREQQRTAASRGRQSMGSIVEGVELPVVELWR